MEGSHLRSNSFSYVTDREKGLAGGVWKGAKAMQEGQNRWSVWLGTDVAWRRGTAGTEL